MGIRRGFLFVVLCSLLLAGAAAGAPSSTHVHVTVNGDVAMNPATSGAVLDSIAAAAPDAHFTVGDLSYQATGTEQQWCDFVHSHVGNGFPYELLSGNHESNGQNGNINDFSACLPNQLPGVVGTYGRQYYVDVPQQQPLVRFVMISPNLTYPDGAWDYSAGSARYQWVANTVDAARAQGIRWVVVGMHKPCLSTGEYNCDVPKSLVDLLMTKKVDLVLSGHEHFYQRTKQLALGAACPTLQLGGYDADCVVDADNDLTQGAGTVFMTVGTGGQTLRDIDTTNPELPYFAASEGGNMNGTYGFGDLDVTPDVLTVSFVRGAGGTFTDGFTITKDANPPPNSPPHAAFTSQVSGLTATFDASGSSDSDGFVQSYAWSFGDGQNGSGVSPSHNYAVPGTYPVSLTVTDDDGATDTVSHDVTVTSGVQVIASDQFERTTTNSWGSADVGGPWTVTSTSGVSSVSGGKGRLVMIAAGKGPTAYLNGPTTTDLDLQLQLSVDTVPTGSGARVDQSVVLRRNAGGDYRAMVRLLTDGRVRVDFLRTLSGTQTAIGGQVFVPGLTYAAGDVLDVRAQARGTSPTTLRAKVWRDGTAEPSAWTNSTTDSSAALQAAGSIGLTPYLGSSATNAPIQARYDNLRAALASTVP